MLNYILFFICVGEENVNVHIGVSDGKHVVFSNTQNDNSIICASELSKTTDEEDGEEGEENKQDLGNVYTTTIIKNLRGEELGVHLFKLTYGEFEQA